jgi:valyl-tRNA synthetase
MSGLYFKKEIPFEDVYIYATVLDEQGKRHSKSLGTGVDPIDVIRLYGADALRFALLVRAARGQDIRFAAIEKDRQPQVEEARNFANKIWNASRFVLMNLGDASGIEARWVPSDALADRWILAELNSAIEQVTSALDEYRINDAAQTIYRFFWDSFCDWYIELTKSVVASREVSDDVVAARCRIVYILETSLRLLHPLMPYITEEIWQQLPHKGDSVMVASWPQSNSAFEDQSARARMETLIALITKVRNIRSEMNIPIQSKLKLWIGTTDSESKDLLNESSEQIKRLARVEEITITDTLPAVQGASRAVVAGMDIAVPLGGLIDFDKERERIIKEKTKKENEARSLAGRLDNISFMERAPREVVQETRSRHEELVTEIEKLQSTLVSLGAG